MSQSLATTMRMHHAIKNESVSGSFTAMRACAGPCKRRRSLTQFAAGSTLCLRCAKRAPK